MAASEPKAEVHRSECDSAKCRRLRYATLASLSNFQTPHPFRKAIPARKHFSVINSAKLVTPAVDQRQRYNLLLRSPNRAAYPPAATAPVLRNRFPAIDPSRAIAG